MLHHNCNNCIIEPISLLKFNGNVDKLEQYARSEGIDISECTAMTQTLRDAALAVISNSSACLNEKIERGQDLLNDISSKYEEALTEIKGIKEKASECLKEIDGIKGAVSAASCVTVVSFFFFFCYLLYNALSDSSPLDELLETITRLFALLYI